MTPNEGKEMNTPGEGEKEHRQDGHSVGEILKKERHKKGLSHDQLFEVTRLRPRFLEALENEDWSSLPSPAFIKGFIRTYASALGLDEARLMELYRQSGEVEDSSPSALAREEGRKGNKVIVLIGVFLVCGALGLYAWKYSGPEETGPEVAPDQGKGSAPSAQVSKGGKAVPPGGGIREKEKSAGSRGFQEDQDVTRPLAARRNKPGSSSGTPEQPSSKEEISSVGYSPSGAKPAEGVGSPELTLRANVSEKTWIRMVIDGERIKEYIFPPGSRAEWRAREGFDILIGNAGGLSLEFEGKEMDNLGRSGEVLRLRLPKGYRGEHWEG